MKLKLSHSGTIDASGRFNLESMRCNKQFRAIGKFDHENIPKALISLLISSFWQSLGISFFKGSQAVVQEIVFGDYLSRFDHDFVPETA